MYIMTQLTVQRYVNREKKTIKKRNGINTPSFDLWVYSISVDFNSKQTLHFTDNPFALVYLDEFYWSLLAVMFLTPNQDLQHKMIINRNS